MIYAVLAIPLLLLAIFAVVRFRAWRAQRLEDQEKHYFKCPKCHRKFGYRARQAGHKACCTYCGQNFIFPQTATKVMSRS